MAYTITTGRLAGRLPFITHIEVYMVLLVFLFMLCAGIFLLPTGGRSGRGRNRPVRFPKVRFPKTRKSKSYQITGKYGAVRRR